MAGPFNGCRSSLVPADHNGGRAVASGPRAAGRLRLPHQLPPLPPDMLAAECTEVILFRLSLLLNRLSGGPAGMTFSARCHQMRRRASMRGTRLIWRLLELLIDLVCVVARAERTHCRAAWQNHCARGRMTAQAGGQDRAETHQIDASPTGVT